MSWLYYETLTVQPDFGSGLDYGIEDERVTVDAQDGPSWGAWPGITDQLFSYTFKTTTGEEFRILREFFNRNAGRAKAFYLPSWRQDFQLALDVTAGATTSLTVAGNWLSENLSEARPDTVGRRIFIINHLGQYADYWVQAAIQDDVNDELQLDRIIANDLVAGKCVIGLVHLVRFASDEIEMSLTGAGLSEVQLSFRKITHTKRTEETFSVDGEDLGEMHGITSLVVTDEDPIAGAGATSLAKGPFIYGAAQDEAYQTDWIARLDHAEQEVILVGPTGEEQVMPLFDPVGIVYNIALTFGALGREVLAWQETTQVAIAWVSGGNNIIRFDGYSPAAFNTFSLDSTVDAGTSAVAVFYLKRNDTHIFCRLLSESFATENRFLSSPMAPLFLSMARRSGNAMQIVGVDAWHRRAIWTSRDYVPPQPVNVLYFAVSEEITGIFRSETAYGDIEAPGPVAQMLQEITGTFVSTRVEATGEPDHLGPVAQMLEEISGSFVSTRVTGAQEFLGPVSQFGEMSGTYFLVRIVGSSDEGMRAAFSEDITGTYSEA